MKLIRAKHIWIVIIILASCTKTPINDPIAENTVSQKLSLTQKIEPSTTSTNIAPTNTAIFVPVTSLTPLPPSPTQTLAFTPVYSIKSPSCLEAGGTMVDQQLEVDILSQPLDLRIYLPPCYEEQLSLSFPVLYLLHGLGYDDDQWDRLGVDEVMDKLIDSGDVSSAIIVLPRDRVWTAPPKNKFGEAIIYYLIPYIDTNYRTLPDRANRAIGGISRGANWAVHLGLSHWRFFGTIGAHSLTVFINDLAHISGWLEAIPAENMPRIFLDVGGNDSKIDNTLWFESLLNTNNIPHEWYLFPGFHDEAYWSSHLELYMKWYLQNW